MKSIKFTNRLPTVNMLKTALTLVVFNVVIDFIIQAIIVERNLHSYYRLPTTTIKTTNSSEDFYILQCPFKSSLNLPPPKDMPICIIVGRHREVQDKQKELTKAKPRSQLNTQVEYRYLKPPLKVIKVVKVNTDKPYTVLLKPVKIQENYKRPKKVVNHDYSNPIKFILQNNQKTTNPSNIVYPVPIVHKIQINNDSLALDTVKEPQKVKKINAPFSQEKDFVDDPIDEEDTDHGPLKYLGVQDTLTQLKLKQTPQHNPAANAKSLYQSEKFFTDLNNSKKGYRTKGYQNMYHRDEIYQDHIFYDDLQQMGNYRIYKKSHV